MTCDGLSHPPGTPEHAHPTGDGVQEQAPPKPGLVRVIWGRHHRSITPFLAIPAVDVTATATHFMTHGGWNAVLATLAEGIIAEITGEIRNVAGKRRPKVRWTARKTVAAATAWGLVASTWTPAGWHGIVQGALLAPGAIAAGVHVHANRKAAKRPAKEEKPGIAPPPDARLEAFRRRFCESANAPLRDAWVGSFTGLSKGFSLEVKFHGDSPHTIADVIRLIPLIAKLYDTSVDNVSVGYVPQHRSEARAQVIVHERADAAAAQTVRTWFDGVSTYNPATGTVRAGGFPDDKRANYLMHVPRSGAGVGMIAGAMGSGKTSVMHRLAAEAGLMAACARCGHARTCKACDLRRICAVFMGDAQGQPMGVWKGKADLLGWEPEGCLELLQFLKTVADTRSSVLGSMEWTDTGPDGRVRHNTGKGWFDPEPGFPLLFAPLSEFPLLVKHQDTALGKEAVALLVMAFTTWRKVGIHVLPDGQFVDMAQMGGRELREAARMWNLIAMRLDKTGSSMTDIKGDPSKLSPDEKGVGYIAGIDGRSDVKFTSDWFPEYNKPGDKGVDVRHVAEEISRTPIAYDSAVTRAMEAFGLTRQQVITEWRGRESKEAAAEPAPAAAGQKGPGVGGLPTSDEAMAVRMALDPSTPVDTYRLMQDTGLSLLAVGRALDFLAANGDVIQRGEDQYTAAPAA